MKKWNRIKAGAATLALGICIGATVYQPTTARSEGQDGANNPPRPNSSGHKPGGQDHDGQPPMGPEEMMTHQLDLTPAQQTKVQAIFEQEREQMRLIHEKTRASIAAILTAKQKTKFAQMPMHGPPGHGPRGNNRHDGPNHDNPGDTRSMMHHENEMQDEDHGRPVELIAKDLGVTPEQFREAFKKVHPAAKGQRPTEEQLQNNHKVLAAALGVSIEKLDAVMDKYRPEGPDGPPRHERE